MKHPTSRVRCLCGLFVKHHYDLRNRKLDCDEARRRHPRATLRCMPLVDTMVKSLDVARARADQDLRTHKKRGE